MSFPRYEAYKDSGVEWLGEVPRDWCVKPLRRCLREHRQGYYSPDEYVDEGIKLLRITDLREHGKIDFSHCPRLEPRADQEQFHLVEGDFVFARTGGAGTFGAVEFLAEPAIYASYLIRFRFSADIDHRFLSHFFMSTGFQESLRRNIHGGVNQNVHAEDIKDQYIALPVAGDQRFIALFLDRETAKIDTLVAEQQRLIELLKEKRQAVISHVVTKGLDPNVPMKDSGVEWLGEVPEHWNVFTLGRITLEKCDGPFGSGLKSEHYTDEGVRVVRLQNIRESGFDDADAAFIDEKYYREELGGHDVLSGDLLIAGLGDDRNVVGRACVAPSGIEPAMVKADCFRFRLDHKRALPSFVATQLTAGAAFDAGVLSTGSTRSRISLSTMASRKLALPPIREQAAIDLFIKGEVERINGLLLEAGNAINLLQERRSVLISAAVTGKIDVRGLASVEAEAA